MPVKKGNIPWNKGKTKGEKPFPKIPALCACGCRAVVWNSKTYCKGHANKGKIRLDKPMLGKHHSAQAKLKISNAKKGQHSLTEWKKGDCNIPTKSRFKKGNTPWNKDKQCPTISDALKNRTFSEEHKKNLSLACEGRIPWDKGIKRPDISKMYVGDKNPAKRAEVKEKMRDAKKGMYIGESNPNWNGGISFEPYCHKFNKELKERIRDRDNRTCQLCGSKENGRKLSVHHVHYDKENCAPDLISLCIRCNPKVNFNRDYYENLFIQKLRDRGLLLQPFDNSLANISNA